MDVTPALQTRHGNDDEAMLAALRTGDERSFTELVERYHGALVRTALAFVRDRDVAEEVAQESWLAVIRGIGRFEGRSRLSTWIFSIAANQARTRAAREMRSVPMSAFEPGPDEPSVEPERFRPPGMPWPGHWLTPPQSWDEDASARLLSRETHAVIARALETLPESQRAVMTLRDVQGLESDEVCTALGISAGNQRVLLHRARSRVRAALETYFGGADGM